MRHGLNVEIPSDIRAKWLEDVVPEVRVSGARTVTSLVTSRLQNPIATYLINRTDESPISSLVVSSVSEHDGVYQLDFEDQTSSRPEVQVEVNLKGHSMDDTMKKSSQLRLNRSPVFEMETVGLGAVPRPTQGCSLACKGRMNRLLGRVADQEGATPSSSNR